MADGGKADRPHTRARCKPTPRPGFWRARATASSAAASLTMRLAVVRMPSRWARMTAWLMAWERPKSSALTIRRRLASRDAIVGRGRAQEQAAPGAENEKGFLAFAQARGARPENLEMPALQLAQQPPINRAHQLGGGHG